MFRFNGKQSYAMTMVVITAALYTCSSLSWAQSEDEPTEEQLIARIAKLSSPQATAADNTGDFFSRHQQAIAAVDELLQKYPNSSARTTALVTKLKLLADLSRFTPDALRRLLELTEKISKNKPEPVLDAENRWYAIQAFVYGARAEGMPGKKRLSGAMERYRAYIEDFPTSNKRPIAYASLIKNLVLAERLEEATKILKRFVKDYPEDTNTLIAQEELLRPKLLGKPFDVIYTSRDGRRISTKDDYKGKVLVIEYWSGHHKKSTVFWSDLMYLLTKHSRQGLDILGVSIDNDPELMKRVFRRDMTPWPNCIDQKIVNVGGGKSLDIYAVPCIIVLDRDGNVYDINHGVELEDVVKQLLNQ